MNNFASFITPEQAADFAIKNGDADPREKLVAKYKRMAKARGTCCNCDEEVWRYAGVGMCFSCTAGEADASDDYELERQ